MSFEVFVAITLVATWALLPLSLVIGLKDFDDEQMSDPHHH